MLVAQLTDLHLGPEERQDFDFNRERFLASLDAVRSLVLEPDLYLITGDITEWGDEASYRFFLRRMRLLGRPWFCLLGNHDRADRFGEVAAREPDERRHVGSVRIGKWRVVGVDTPMAGWTAAVSMRSAASGSPPCSRRSRAFPPSSRCTILPCRRAWRGSIRLPMRDGSSASAP